MQSFPVGVIRRRRLYKVRIVLIVIWMRYYLASKHTHSEKVRNARLSIPGPKIIKQNNLSKVPVLTSNEYANDIPTSPLMILSLLITANNPAKNITQLPRNSRRMASHLNNEFQWGFFVNNNNNNNKQTDKQKWGEFPYHERTTSISIPPGWDASTLQVTPQHFVRFSRQFAGTHLYSWVERGIVRKSI